MVVVMNAPSVLSYPKGRMKCFWFAGLRDQKYRAELRFMLSGLRLFLFHSICDA
jgi:hypothetical protein